jgi:hypothetical protein
MPTERPQAGWRWAAASVCGTGHELHGEPCQDSHGLECLAPDILVAAVADGAGSARQAAQGSSLAVQSALAAIRSQHLRLHEDLPDEAWRGVLEDVLGAARATLQSEADRMASALGDWATTLIVLVARPQVVAAAQIGDGASIVAETKSGFQLLTAPAQTEYLNETVFLTSGEGLPAAQYGVWRGQVGGVALLSDGLQMLALKLGESRVHAPFFAPLFRFLAQEPREAERTQALGDFLRAPRVRQRTDDDLTLVLGQFAG